MSIATRITSIEEHITNAYDKIDDLGIDLTDVDKNIDNIATVLEEYYDDQPKVTGEGTEVTLEGTKAGKIGIDVQGNSTQETTEGKQLFDGQLENGQLSSSTGEPEGSQTDRKRTVNFVDVSNLSSVTLSFEVTSTASAYGRFFLYDENKAFISNTQIASTTKTVDVSNASYVKWWGSTVIKENTIMLNNGSTALPYEEYTGGIPSPNPSFSQPINSAGDNGTITEKIVNKNLAQHIAGYLTNAGVFKTSNDDSFYFYVIKGKTYIYNCTGNRTNAAIFNKIPENNDTCIVGTYQSPLSKNTPFVAQETGYMVIYANTPTSTDTINSFIANAGSTATDYVAHQEQTFIIPCQQPMRDKGTVKDLFIKIAGNWFERHYIGKYKFTGNETISITNSGGSNWFYAISIPSILMNGDGVASNSRCTHYKAARIATSSTEEGYYFVSDTKTMRIRFGTEDTVANYKAWLANNDVQFEYISKNYTDLPCTEEQTIALEAIRKAKSYEDTTIIYSEDGTPAYLNATALKK